MRTRSKNTFILLLMSILLVFAANSMVFAGAGEPGAGGGGGDEKYSGPAAIVELTITPCPDPLPEYVQVTGTSKCKGTIKPILVECGGLLLQEVCEECTELGEIIEDDLLGYELYNQTNDVCDVDADPAVVRVITKFENSDSVINARGVCLFEKSQF